MTLKLFSHFAPIGALNYITNRFANLSLCTYTFTAIHARDDRLFGNEPPNQPLKKIAQLFFWQNCPAVLYFRDSDSIILQKPRIERLALAWHVLLRGQPDSDYQYQFTRYARHSATFIPPQIAKLFNTLSIPYKFSSRAL